MVGVVGAVGGRPTGPVGPQQVPWRLYKRPMEPTRVVSDDELESIHLASLEVLRDVGMDFLHPKALEMWAEAGATIDGERVRFDPELITELISSVPSEVHDARRIRRTTS